MEIAIWVLSVLTILGWFLFLVTASLLNVQREMIDIYKKSNAIWKSSALGFEEQCKKWEQYGKAVQEVDKSLLNEIERTEKEIKKLREGNTTEQAPIV